MTQYFLPTTLTALALVLSGCGAHPPDQISTSNPGDPPTGPWESIDYTFPTEPGNRTHVAGLMPSATESLDRVYLRGQARPGQDVVALDLDGFRLGHGDAPGDAYPVAAAHANGVGTVLLETGATVHVLQEQGLSFTSVGDPYPGYRVSSAALLEGTPYALLLNLDLLGGHLLLKIQEGRATEVPLDPAVDRSSFNPTLGGDGSTLSLCQRHVPDGSLQAIIMDGDGQVLATHVLDPAGALANVCHASLAAGLHAFAWANARGETMVARLTAGLPEIHAVAQGYIPDGLWVGANASFVLAHDPEARPWLLAGQLGQAGWKVCSVTVDDRDDVILQSAGGDVWVLRAPYNSDPVYRLEGERLDGQKCPFQHQRQL